MDENQSIKPIDEEPAQKKKTLWEYIKLAMMGDISVYFQALESGKYPKRWFIVLTLICGFILGCTYCVVNSISNDDKTYVSNKTSESTNTTSSYAGNLDLQKIPPGEYKVDVEIPAGEYKIVQNTNADAYYCISGIAEDGQKYIVKNNFVTNKGYVIVSKGQYLAISRGYAELLSSQEKVDNTSINNSDEWKLVKKFEGTTKQDTETFNIQSSNWRIRWNIGPPLGGMKPFFRIEVYNNQVGLVGNMIHDMDLNSQGIISGNSEFPGQYKLHIDADLKYTIYVEEKADEPR